MNKMPIPIYSTRQRRRSSSINYAHALVVPAAAIVAFVLAKLLFQIP